MRPLVVSTFDTTDIQVSVYYSCPSLRLLFCCYFERTCRCIWFLFFYIFSPAFHRQGERRIKKQKNKQKGKCSQHSKIDVATCSGGGGIVKYLTTNRLLFLLCRDERKKRVRVQEKGCCPADGGSIDKLKVNNPTECTRRRFLYSGANTVLALICRTLRARSTCVSVCVCVCVCRAR